MTEPNKAPKEKHSNNPTTENVRAQQSLEKTQQSDKTRQSTERTQQSAEKSPLKNRTRARNRARDYQGTKYNFKILDRQILPKRA